MAELSDILQSFRTQRPYRLRVILLCAMAATTFWFLNALNKEHTTTINYPLQFMYDPQNYVELEALPASVTINVNGIGWNLLKNNLGVRITPLQIPLQNPSEQKKIAASSLPSLISEQLSEFELNYVLTDTLYVNLDRRAEKVFYLRVDSLQVPLAAMRRMSSAIRVTPDSFEISGPESLLNNLQDTIFLDLGETPVESDVNDQVDIPISNQRLNLSTDEARVTFSVEALVEKSVLVPIEKLNFTDTTLNIFPDEIRLYYTVSENQDVALTREDFRVVVEYGSLGEDSTFTPVLAERPDGIAFVRSDSVKVQLLGK